jgi:hypothetical protein
MKQNSRYIKINKLIFMHALHERTVPDMGSAMTLYSRLIASSSSSTANFGVDDDLLIMRSYLVKTAARRLSCATWVGWGTLL